MNPLFIKILTGIGVGVLFSSAALLMLLLRNSKFPHYTHQFTDSYLNDPTASYVCGICLEEIDITTDENRVFVLPCRHKFHRECLKQLFVEQRTNRRCPYCRRHIHENVVSRCL